MRIKSYFASSVQAAIGLARREFGDEVTLVTSHVAPLESRQLGDYEVVFAIDDVPVAEETVEEESQTAEPGRAAPVPVAVPVAAAPVVVPSLPAKAIEKPAFETVYQKEIAKPASTEQGIEEKLDQLRTSFVEMGIEPMMVRALLLMVERSLPVAPPVSSVLPEEEETAFVEAAEPAHPEAAKFTPAEMEFFLSVSGVSA